MTSIQTTVLGDYGNQLIPIITTEHKTLKFHADNLARLLDHEILKDTPIAIVSIAGKKRLGKSLFLNLLLHYLKKRGWESNTDDWLTGWNSSMHDGFVERGGNNPVTTGIIAWGEPIFVHSPARNEEIAIILLDTEGTFDTANRDVSVGIFAMSTLSSSLQIYNIDKQITLDDLDYLKYFTKQARIAAKNQPMTDVDSGRSSLTNQSRFENLAFLIRNWSNSDRSYGIEGGREYLQQELAKFEDNNDHIHVVDGRHPIYGAFQNVSCFLMPEPDKKVRVRGEKGPPLDVGDLGKEFISFTTAFAREYLYPDKLPTKLMKANHLLEYLKQCGTRIEDGCLPKLKDIDELMAQHVIRKAKETATDTFISAMEKFIEEVEKPDWKSFDDTVKKQKQLVTDNFRSEVRLYVSEVTLEAEVAKMQQTLDEKIGNELVKKMQKKIIPYAKKEILKLFVSTVKTKMTVEELIWENFDEAIKTQKTKMQKKFLQQVLRGDNNVNLGNDKVDLEKKLTEKASGHLSNSMRHKRKSYVKGVSKNSLDEAKKQLDEYCNNKWFPLPYFGTKTIREQYAKDFKELVEEDQRDSKVVKDIVNGFETLAKDEARSGDFIILGRYASSAVIGGAAATLCAVFPPAAAPVAVVATLATVTGVGSFTGVMAIPKIVDYGSKAWAYVSQKIRQKSNRQKED